MKRWWVLNAALSMNKSQYEQICLSAGLCLVAAPGTKKNHSLCRAWPQGSSDPPCTELGLTGEHTKGHRGRRSECSFKIRGFFSSVLTGSTGQTLWLQVNELSEKAAQGDRSLRSETQDRKSINRLLKVNGILVCVTLNGALNLYAV